eukprot:Clim_evm10s11 gene=Clim_evmTU10s11
MAPNQDTTPRSDETSHTILRREEKLSLAPNLVNFGFKTPRGMHSSTESFASDENLSTLYQHLQQNGFSLSSGNFRASCYHCIPRSFGKMRHLVGPESYGDQMPGMEKGYGVDVRRKFGGILHLLMGDIIHSFAGPVQGRKFPVVKLIMESDTMDKTIEKIAETEGTPVEQLRKSATKMIKRMRGRVNWYVARVTAFVLTKLFRHVFGHFYADERKMLMLEEISKAGHPIVFVSLHKSHLDYLVNSYFAYLCRMEIPHIAAGDNLNVPVVAQIFTRLGAFFIRRGRAAVTDPLYRGVFSEYVHQVLAAGENLEFFPEGGRSRIGKPLVPKLGMLSMLVELAVFKDVVDPYIVPITVNYERIVEMAYPRELLGTPKKPETFLWFAWNLIKLCFVSYGPISVDLGMPFSLQDFVRNVQPSSLSRDGSLVAVAAYTEANGYQSEGPAPRLNLKQIAASESAVNKTSMDEIDEVVIRTAEDLGRHVIHQATIHSTIMPTMTTAAILLIFRRDFWVVDMDTDTIPKVETVHGYMAGFNSYLITSLRNRGRRYLHTVGENKGLIESATAECEATGTKQQQRVGDGSSTDKIAVAELQHSLNCLQLDPDTIYRPEGDPEKILHLCFYANHVFAQFCNDALIIASLRILQEQGIPAELHTIVEYAELLTMYLAFEFCFCLPCQSIEESVKAHLSLLIDEGLVLVDENVAIVNDMVWDQRGFGDERRIYMYAFIRLLTYQFVPYLVGYRAMLTALIDELGVPPHHESYAEHVKHPHIHDDEGPVLTAKVNQQQLLLRVQKELMAGSNSQKVDEAASMAILQNAISLFVKQEILAVTYEVPEADQGKPNARSKPHLSWNRDLICTANKVHSIEHHLDMSIAALHRHI